MTAPKVALRRLNQLADLLDTVDALHRKNKEPKYDQLELWHPCGTPACALGHWAAANPRRWVYRVEYDVDENGKPDHTRAFDVDIYLKGEETSGAFVGAMEEFDLTEEQVDELFETTGCGGAKTAKAAAAYIRQFAKVRSAQYKLEALSRSKSYG